MTEFGEALMPRSKLWGIRAAEIESAADFLSRGNEED